MNRKLILSLVILEIILSITMALIVNTNYKAVYFVYKIIWRVVLLLPLFFIVIISIRKSYSLYKVLFLIGFCIIFVADMIIIFDDLSGLFVFLLLHILNIFTFIYIYMKNNIKKWVINWDIIVFIVMIISWFLIYNFTISIEDIVSYITNPSNKAPLWTSQNPDLIRLILFFYIVMVLISAWRGFALISLPDINNIFVWCAFFGTLFFACGDFLIFIDIFKNKGKTFHQIINNSLYYIPLIMLSLLTVINPKKKNRGSLVKKI